MAVHVVAPVAELPPGARKRVTVKGRTIAVFNVDGNYYALLDRCPHEGASLCHGTLGSLVESDEPGTYRVSRQGEILRCPWHGWEFDVRTGQSWCDPVRIRVRQYPAHVEAGERLVQGPYVAETFPVRAEDSYVVLDL